MPLPLSNMNTAIPGDELVRRDRLRLVARIRAKANGLPYHSEGLPAQRATLETQVRMHSPHANPERVPYRHRKRDARHHPWCGTALRFVLEPRLYGGVSRVAASPQPFAMMRKPFGLELDDSTVSNAPPSSCSVRMPGLLAQQHSCFRKHGIMSLAQAIANSAGRIFRRSRYSRMKP